MVTDFKAGDAVKLKLNNQQMMVRSVVEQVNSNARAEVKSYECIWYDNAKLQCAFFTEDLLEWLAPDYDILHFANYE